MEEAVQEVRQTNNIVAFFDDYDLFCKLPFKNMANHNQKLHIDRLTWLFPSTC